MNKPKVLITSTLPEDAADWLRDQGMGMIFFKDFDYRYVSAVSHKRGVMFTFREDFPCEILTMFLLKFGGTIMK